MKKNESQTLKECRISLWHPLKLKLMLHWILIAVIHWEQDGYTRTQCGSSMLYTSLMPLHKQHTSASCIFNINEKIFTFSYTLQIITFLHLEWMRTRFNRYSSSQVTKLIASLLPNLFISWPGKCFLHVSSFLGNFHSAAVSLRSGQFCTRK